MTIIQTTAVNIRPDSEPMYSEQAITDLLDCPFCGKPLSVRTNGSNPRAQCVTQGCKGSQLPVLRLDDENDIASWNTRAKAGK